MSDVKEKVENFSSSMEDIIDKVGQPVKPYIPIIARFLIVATFLEDALRIVTQWSAQVDFMESRRGFPTGLSHLFLFLNVVVSDFIYLLKKKKEGVFINNNNHYYHFTYLL